MVAAIETPFGHPLPDTPSIHAITTHAAGWETIQGFADQDPEILAKIKTIYPRFGPWSEAKTLIETIVSKLQPEQICLLFPGRSSAEACKDYITSPDRKEDVVAADEVSVKAFDFHVRVYATVFPAKKITIAVPFWQDPGTAISTRFAEDCLKHVDLLKEVDIDSPASAWPTITAVDTIKQRIVELLERAPVAPHSKEVSTDDIYLYQTGMAAIYQPHLYLSEERPGTTILYGFAFHSTPHVFQHYGSNKEHFKWFALGGDAELEALESFIKSEIETGRSIQALWAEFPTNPNLTVPSIKTLKALGTRYSFPMIIDDTVASFANVDLLGDSGADAVMTSLTKTFSGYADVMAGSIVLNPSSAFYTSLKTIFDKHYVNELYPLDAEALERNSRDYLQRTAIYNRNARHLVEQLSQTKYSHLIDKVYYPTTDPSSLVNYKPHLRPATPELQNPGYGCLLSLSFHTLPQCIAFYNNLSLHIGPHLGAHKTLALAYHKLLVAAAQKLGSEDIISKGGMSERTIRISVGLEDEGEIWEAVEAALNRAGEIAQREAVESAGVVIG